MSALPLSLMLHGASVKLMRAQQVVGSFRKLGLPEGAMLPIGLTEVICVLYAAPRTAGLGAILVTG
jgi:DoxX-like family